LLLIGEPADEISDRRPLGSILKGARGKRGGCAAVPRVPHRDRLAEQRFGLGRIDRQRFVEIAERRGLLVAGEEHRAAVDQRCESNLAGGGRFTKQRGRALADRVLARVMNRRRLVTGAGKGQIVGERGVRCGSRASEKQRQSRIEHDRFHLGSPSLCRRAGDSCGDGPFTTNGTTAGASFDEPTDG
jgi:hypothetical protein